MVLQNNVVMSKVAKLLIGKILLYFRDKRGDKVIQGHYYYTYNFKMKLIPPELHFTNETSM